MDPPPYTSRDENETLPAAILTLSGTSITAETDGQEEQHKPAYQLSRDILTPTPNNQSSSSNSSSSVSFNRIDPISHHIAKDQKDSPETAPKTHIFYLAHPPCSPIKTKAHQPAYYATCLPTVKPVGNIQLTPAKAPLHLPQKPEFKALLSSGRTYADQPLFNEDPAQREVLFHAKPKLKGLRAQYRWVGRDGAVLALEESSSGAGGRGEKRRLHVLVPLSRALRDALAATWMLRIWYEKMESSEARREALENMIPPEAYLNSVADTKLGKRAGALGGFAAGGGA
ncbi:uncharacterized protein BDW47DRAFT_133282 [Aspergillus candidus]|uniref:Uncharacterized protein n=1 Tax=Aspergillus candidus TaxID=41067 RepID=A0A2I2F574_ASPCN|nr:hypothetical protein BDW47DRAFT_133282 [Aspergillus candidus]PLB35792.1 hypothetical protein BDW47DRAFT_133282 [Aspergillus candidus]